MGKVRDETTASSAKAAAKAAPGRPSWVTETARRTVPFFTNLLKADPYKPNQGWYARVWTAVGLAALFGVGIFRIYQNMQAGTSGSVARLAVPGLLAAALGWLVFRVVHYPPFADFLIATEAEMNKVSWTSKADLYRATMVVLVTVLLMAVFLFLVDTLWSNLLQWLGVLRFDGGGAFGTTS